MLPHVLIARGALYLFRSHGIRSEILVKRVTGRIQKKPGMIFFHKTWDGLGGNPREFRFSLHFFL
jgi:hypothetical protein